MEWDGGPPPDIAELFDRAPLDEYRSFPGRFRQEWGPIYYRGRLDGSARVLVVGQDPAADENIARRIMVGTAGQRLQGFLGKIGLTRSYVIVNASLYSIYGQFDAEMMDFVDRPPVAAWMHDLLDALAHPELEAILAFGRGAQHVVENWPGAAHFKAQGRLFKLLHPTARPVSTVLQDWGGKLNAVVGKVTPDADAVPHPAPYGSTAFRAGDLSPIPLRDLPFGAPHWMGTGKMAVRVAAGESATATDSSILWTAVGPQG